MNSTGIALKFEKYFIPVYCFAAVAVALGTLYFTCLAYHAGPFRDMWVAMDFIRAWQDGMAEWHDLFALHGGSHRLAFPRFLFLLEYQVFSGSNVFLMAVAFAVQTSVVVLVWQLAKQEQHMAKNYQWFMVALSLILMLNATQLENFVYTFDVQWFITSAAAVWALMFWNYFFKDISGQKRIPIKTLVSAIVMTLVSMFSSFSGLCVWLVLPVLVIIYGVRHKEIYVLLVLAVIALYLRGPFATGGNWQTPAYVTMDMVLRSLWLLLLLLLQWIGLYFGSPLSRFSSVVGTIVAYGSLLFLVWQWWRLFRFGVKDHTSFQLVMLSAALWAAIVGLATGIGRMYFVHTAPEDRYQSIVLVYWLGVFGYSWSRVLQVQIQSRDFHYKHATMGLIIFWTCLVIPFASLKDARMQISFFDRINNVDLAIATGQWDYNEIKDTLILGDKTKKINRPEMYASFLRDQHWGVFASPRFTLLGTTIDRTAVSADRCEGEVDMITAVNAPYRGYRITGRGEDVQRESLLRSYVAVDETDRVVGLGRLQRQKYSLLPLTWQPLESAHWLLYTENLDDGQHDLQILGELEEGGYCVMASAKLPTSPG